MTFKEEALPKSCKTWDFSTFFCITSYFLQFLFVSTKKKDFWNPCWNEISTSQAKLSFGKLWILVQLPTLCFGGWGQRTGDQPRPRPRWGPRPTKTYTGLTWTRSKWVGETDQDQDPTPSSPSLKIIDIRMKWKWYFDIVIMMTQFHKMNTTTNGCDAQDDEVRQEASSTWHCSVDQVKEKGSKRFQFTNSSWCMYCTT